jgi:hypothetical protein
MKKILKQDYLNFDEHLDIDSLVNMKEQLCAAFCDAWLGLGKGNQALPAVAGHTLNWPANTHKGIELSAAVRHAFKNPDALGHEKVKNYIENGHPIYANMFMKLITDSQGIGYNIFIRQPTTHDYNDKHLAAKTKESLFYDKFVFFVDWVNAQDIFKEIGRIVIFFNDQDQYCLKHRDRSLVNTVLNPDEFIWINVFQDRKKFYIEDELGNRSYLNGYVNWFDTANWHGSEASPFAAFSIRVDGVFSKAFMKRIGYKRKSKRVFSKQ